MPLRFELRGSAKGALPAPAVAHLKRIAGRMIRAAALARSELGPPSTVEVGLTLTDDEEIQQLNFDYRKKDAPTDVLAFSMTEGEGGHLTPGLLGDVVISVETARRQAGRRGLAHEVAFLWAHGLCHLLGYDHRTDAEEAAMNARMAALLAEGKRVGRVKAA